MFWAFFGFCIIFVKVFSFTVIIFAKVVSFTVNKDQFLVTGIRKRTKAFLSLINEI